MNKKTVSKIMLILLLLGMLTLAFIIQPVRASGTIYIRPDGTVEGTDKIQRDGDVYTFTDDIYGEIVVERSNIIIDGKGYKLQGSGRTGFDLTSARISNVTIQNTNISNFGSGISIWSSRNIVSRNNITNNGSGIYLTMGSNNIISENNITNNGRGICGDAPLHYNIISENNITNNNRHGISFEDGFWGNTISRNNIMTNGWAGISIVYFCGSNNICGNNITNNNGGIYLHVNCRNAISGNNITANNEYGISLSAHDLDTFFNIIFGNIIASHNYGIYLRSGKYPQIGGRTRDNTIYGNNVTDNYSGIKLYAASDNTFFHNNFIGNTQQVHDVSWENPEVSPSVNTWDDGYPSGGNYWSDHVTVDVCCGVNQDELGSDGIGDTPYIIDEDNVDNYPLMPTSETINYVIQSLPSSEFTKPEEDVADMKNDFADKFADVEENVEEGDFERAIEHLAEIRDFVFEQIVESGERQKIVSMIDGLIAYLENFL